VTEAIPYVGPIIGAVPPVIVALFNSPLTALWVALAFLVIHQLEGHIVVPRVMGHALGAHPLAIIFGLLAGAEIYGVPGVLLSLPLIAMGREIWTFLRPRVSLERWPTVSLVGAGLEPEPPPPGVAPVGLPSSPGAPPADKPVPAPTDRLSAERAATTRSAVDVDPAS
jgi:hypothetical protein